MVCGDFGRAACKEVPTQLATDGSLFREKQRNEGARKGVHPWFRGRQHSADICQSRFNPNQCELYKSESLR